MKKKINSINDFINNHLSAIILTFIFVQPLLDLLTSLEIHVLHLGVSIGSIVRLLFLLFCSYYVLFINKEKKFKYLIGAIGLYISLFALVILKYKGLNIFFYEVRNGIDTFYLPVILISFYLMFKNKAINIKINHIVILYLICVAFVLFPNLTHTGFLSYYHSKVGSVGWFYSANAIGNMFAFLLPFMFFYIIKSKIHIIIKVIISLSTVYVFLSMGTKVPVLGLALSLLVNFIYYFVIWIKNKNYKLICASIGAFIIGIISMIIVLPKTSFYENIQIHKKFLGFDHYYEIFTDYHLVDHFIFSQRLTFLKNTNNNFKKVSVTEKVLGMGYIENYATDDATDKTIEMDYFEVFYRHGIVGCILFYLILIPFIYIFIITKHEKSLMNMEFKLCMALILLLSLFSGHVLVTPSIAIFVALIINIFINKDNYYNFSLDTIDNKEINNGRNRKNNKGKK